PKIIIKTILQKMEFIQTIKIPVALAILLFASVCQDILEKLPRTTLQKCNCSLFNNKYGGNLCQS
ncbi:MAG: hypothetical protein ACE5KT_12325, partial [Methanosarcinales archaeon]